MKLNLNMDKNEVINSYIQGLKNGTVSTIGNFIQEEFSVEGSDVQRIEDELYHEIFSSDYYELLINKSSETKSGTTAFFALTSEAARALRKFSTLQEYCDSKSELSTNRSQNITFNAPVSVSNSNFLSDHSSVTTSDEALLQLENMITLLENNQKIDALLKAKLMEMNTDLQEMINKSKTSNLPIIDNLISLAANLTSLFPLIK
jgi:hypothetical protein